MRCELFAGDACPTGFTCTFNQNDCLVTHILKRLSASSTNPFCVPRTTTRRSLIPCQSMTTNVSATKSCNACRRSVKPAIRNPIIRIRPDSHLAA
jgi:hypothetical protein